MEFIVIHIMSGEFGDEGSICVAYFIDTRDALLHFGGQRFKIYVDSGFIKYIRYMYM
jgi:hypothetical protein